MKFRISPLWWPLLVVASPIIILFLAAKHVRFNKNLRIADEKNEKRLKKAKPFELPELEYLDMTVIVEEKAEEGFKSDAAVSYLFKSDQGSLLFDVGFGTDRPAFVHNAKKLGVNLDEVDSVMISHLHLDHMGGMKAHKSHCVAVPEEIGLPSGQPCFIPEQGTANGDFKTEMIDCPKLLPGGFASTGPLSRSFVYFGMTDEQALFARVKGLGLVIITGCGHPTIELIVKMVQKISDEPIHVIGGGFHFPVTESRGAKAGIQFQMLFGTGKPFWQKINDNDLSETIGAINEISPAMVLPSAHDTCDHALNRMENELHSKTETLRAGKTYRFQTPI